MKYSKGTTTPYSHSDEALRNAVDDCDVHSVISVTVGLAVNKRHWNNILARFSAKILPSQGLLGFLSQAEIACDDDILAETFAWKVTQKREVSLLSRRIMVSSLKLWV